MFLACIDHLKREKGLGGFKPRRPTSHSQQAETPRQMAEAVRLRLDPATPVKPAGQTPSPGGPDRSEAGYRSKG